MHENTILASLCITCYNQVQFIKESLQSAFDQTYSPLEIVICDDCSTDGTDKIIEEMVSKYESTGGKHKVIYKRNTENLYVARNYEQAFRLGSGIVRVTGAGDDISMPDRVERIVETWKSAHEKQRNVVCLMHAWIDIDQNGNNLGVGGPWGVNSPLGAAAAYQKDVFEVFPQLTGECRFYEDDLFVLRACAIGEVLLMDKPLIKYRTTSGLSHNGGTRRMRGNLALGVVRSCKVFSKELEAVKDVISKENYARVNDIIKWKIKHYSAEADLYQARFFWKRLSGLIRKAIYDKWSLITIIRKSVFVLPECLERVLRRTISICHNMQPNTRKSLSSSSATSRKW